MYNSTYQDVLLTNHSFDLFTFLFSCSFSPVLDKPFFLLPTYLRDQLVFLHNQTAKLSCSELLNTFFTRSAHPL